MRWCPRAKPLWHGSHKKIGFGNVTLLLSGSDPFALAKAFGFEPSSPQPEIRRLPLPGPEKSA
jgi:hypothetical protein